MVRVLKAPPIKNQTPGSAQVPAFQINLPSRQRMWTKIWGKLSLALFKNGRRPFAPPTSWKRLVAPLLLPLLLLRYLLLLLLRCLLMPLFLLLLQPVLELLQLRIEKS